MSNVFKKMAGNTNHLLVIIWPLGVILSVLSLALMYEDYDTSRLGYIALPTLKVNYTWIPFVVAALPQVSQVVLFYIFGRDTHKGWALLIASGFFLIDIGTDSWYKSGGNWNLMPLAVIESLFIFTLGSEVLFTVAVGFITETFGEFIIAFSLFLKSIVSGIGMALDALGLSVKDEHDNMRNKR